jgi:CPA1 family monovalent cation:H+ antiporter
MSEIQSLIFLVVAAALLSQLALMLRVPYPVFLVLGGVAIGFVPGLPTLTIPPEVIFLVFLPPLLHASAYSSSPLDLRAQLRPILLLALGLVLVTAAAIALVAHFVIGLPWAAAFVLGGILAPTDPVAADAVFRRLGIPDRVATILGGESLVNDGSGLVIYQLAVAAVLTGTFSVLKAGFQFLLVGGGGLIFGLVAARLLLPLWSRLREPSIVISLSLLIPYGVYVVADTVLGISGILAVVAYGLYGSWRSTNLYSQASTRLQSYSFWQVLVFLLEVLLFVLLGQQLPSILDNMGEYSPLELLLYAALVYVVLVGVRFASFFGEPYLHPVIDRFLRTEYPRTSRRERLVMGWSGMRGAVSLAAALAIPLTTDAGSPFPGRDLILFLAFSVILGTLIFQGLTLGPLVNALNLKNDDNADKVDELTARLAATNRALQTLDHTASAETGSDDVSARNRERMREYYEERAHRYEAGLSAGGTTPEYADSSESWRSWRRRLLASEREALISLRKRGEISQEAMRRVERDLDLEESRIDG